MTVVKPELTINVFHLVDVINEYISSQVTLSIIPLLTPITRFPINSEANVHVRLLVGAHNTSRLKIDW